MDNIGGEISDSLLRDSEEFQNLSSQHRELDVRLSDLAGKVFLNDLEKIETSTLKKQKLAIKDRMADIMRNQ